MKKTQGHTLKLSKSHTGTDMNQDHRKFFVFNVLKKKNTFNASEVEFKSVGKITVKKE